MPKSDTGDMILVVTDLKKVRDFLKDVVGLSEVSPDPAKPDEATFQLSNQKKITVYEEPISTATIRKHSLEIRTENFDQTLNAYNAIYGNPVRATSAEADVIPAKSYSEGTVTAITMDIGFARIRVTRLP